MKKRENPFANSYTDIREQAQELADQLQMECGVAKLAEDQFEFFILPGREFRFGRDARCEIVYPRKPEGK